MPPHLQRILRPKRLLLLGELLKAHEFPDSQLISDIAQGSRVTGWLPDTGVRPTKVAPPSLSVARNREVWASTTASAQPHLGRALWDQTLKECAKGWAVLETGHVEAPKNCVLGRRFPVEQPGKVRPIDDVSVSMVNATLGCEEKITFMPASVSIALALHLRNLLPAQVELAGRTFDLKSAYKQLGVHAEDLPFVKVVVHSPEHGRRVVLALQALPFGARGSVHGFVRCILALWFLLDKFLAVPATHFYDDFTCVTRAEDSVNAEASLHLLFSLLRWEVAKEGNKANAFQRCFTSLGSLAPAASRTSVG